MLSSLPCWDDVRSKTFSTMFVWTVFVLSLLSMASACSVQDDICTDLTSVQQEIVNEHNHFRRIVDPPATNMLKMSWNPEVAASAQEWANTCALAHGSASTRMMNGYQLGENLFKSSILIKWSVVVDTWHSEVNNFEYPDVSTNGEAIGHYTQVVWYSSYNVGCGVAKCGDYYFYACRYYRAGNFKDVPPYTIGETCSACLHACEDNLCTNPCPYIDYYPNCPSLLEQGTCENEAVVKDCPALCLCKTEIIPVGKK